MRTYIIGIVTILFMVACSSSRKAAKSVAKDTAVSVWQPGECVTTKANLQFCTAKGKGVSVGGTLRMKRDDVILLNATYILGIQIGTLELTPDSVLIVSRYTRQYVRMSYSELSSLVGRSVTFNDMQNIFWGDGKDFHVASIDWKYGNFATMEDNRRLPEELELTFAGGATSLDMVLRLSNHKYEDGWTSRTSFNSATYEQVTPEQIKRLISTLMGKE